MTDPLGLIGNTGPANPLVRGPVRGQPGEGPGFKQLLEEQIAKVNELQRDAKEAIEDLAAGRRDDVESVIHATQQADTAFKMLLQVRNKVMEAYDEVKQIHV